MNLRFNQGAIVELALRGFAKPTSIIGKVVNVLPDEIELCPQLVVIQNGKWGNSTADDIYTIHLRRELIWNWKYAHILSINTLEADYISNTNEHHITHLNGTKSFSEYHLNHFEKDGLCRGNGPFYGNIKEESSIGVNLLDDDGK